MIELRDATAEDFRRIKLGRFDAISAPPGDLPAAGQFWAGRAVVAAEGENVLGIAGFIVRGDEAAVSMLLSDELRRRPHFLHRKARRLLAPFMRARGLRRLHATVHREFGAAKRWLERLGFVYDGGEGEWLRYVYERH